MFTVGEGVEGDFTMHIVSHTLDRRLLVGLRLPRPANDYQRLKKSQDDQNELWSNREREWLNKVSVLFKTRAAY